MRKWIAMAFALLLLAACAIPVLAADDYENVDVDPVTGEVKQPGSVQSGSVFHIGSNCTYDPATGYYSFSAAGVEQAVTSNVADGMVTTNSVTLLMDDGLYYTVYRNGKAVKPEGNAVAEPGGYVVEVIGNSGNPEQPLSFTIVGKLTNSVRNYAMPIGFGVTNFLRDGKPVAFDSSLVTFDEDGTYTVDYVCVASGVTYRLEFVTDYTAPTLRLDGVENGKIHGPVDLSDAEPGADVRVIRDGKEISYKKTLTESGKYTVIITDAAGNSSTYSFVILMYLNTNSVVLFAVVGLLIVLFAVYLLRRSRKVRVR